jgi:hypothetical protein
LLGPSYPKSYSSPTRSESLVRIGGDHYRKTADSCIGVGDIEVGPIKPFRAIKNCPYRRRRNTQGSRIAGVGCRNPVGGRTATIRLDYEQTHWYQYDDKNDEETDKDADDQCRTAPSPSRDFLTCFDWLS